MNKQLKEIEERFFIISKELHESKNSWIGLLCFSKFPQYHMIDRFVLRLDELDEKSRREFKHIPVMSEELIYKAIESLEYLKPWGLDNDKDLGTGVTLHIGFKNIWLTKLTGSGVDYSEFARNLCSLVERKYHRNIKMSIEKIIDYLELHFNKNDIRYYVDGESTIYEHFMTKSNNSTK